jgi:hypothetical protein
VSHVLSTLALLASEGGKKSLWDPTIIGVLTVLAGVVLFCGSTYLLLATNVGARLGFMIAAAGLSGIMVLLSTLWLVTSTPLNSPKGRTPQWKTIDCPEGNKTCGTVDDLGSAPIDKIARLANDSKAELLAPAKYQELRPAVDAALIKKEAAPGAEAPEQPYAKFASSASFLTSAPIDALGNPAKIGKETLREYVVGGGTKLMIFHQPRYAAVEYCVAKPQASDEDPNVKPLPAGCDPGKPHKWMLFVHDYGSIRLPPLMYLIFSTSLFAVAIYALHSRELLQRQAARAPMPVPA